MRKVLITGGAGFIGANFVHYYYATHPEDELVVLDKLTYCGNLENLKELEGRMRYRFVKGDIADKDFVFDLFKQEKFDLVVNFAAETHVDNSIEEPAVFIETNIVGTHNLLMACKDFGDADSAGMIRFHQVSTDEVFGDLGDTQGTYFNEETPYEPSSPYSASKASADMLCRAYFRTYGLPMTISNCSNNYGAYQYPEKLIPFFFMLAKEGKSLPVYGDGKQVRDWLYVEDHCRAIDLILEKGKLGETYCIGGNNEKQNLEIVKEIVKYTGGSEDLITYVTDRKGHDRRYAIDASKIRNELGFSPSITFEEGMKKTLDWYEANERWMENLRENE
ncbi:MAG: dTDP-glucose 4,6-dehydratase [Candidatus Peregrinibacteria bacterium]|nr:dTDP-glucose 4,6-dehydratase [Candidatus Peregrinibacteria bacterium]MDZ4245460.1 dTDP-glucose 4,6-dehydratase [Candidatus Gracilibacteria bacterium]